MRLLIESGSLKGRTFEVPPEGLAIGRREECQVRFDEADDVVSGLHARILLREDRWMIVDAGSRNGTLLDGRPVHESPLAHGQVITFGHSGPAARVELPRPASAAVDPAVHRTGMTAVYQAARRQAGANTDSPPSDTAVMKAFVQLAHQRTTRRWQMVLAACLVLGLAALGGLYLAGRRQTAQLEQRIAALSAELETQGDARASLETQLQQMAASAPATRITQPARSEAQVQRQRDAVQQDRRFGPAVTQRFAGGVGMIQFQVGWHNSEHGWLRLRGTASGEVEFTSDTNAPMALNYTAHCTGFLVDASGLVLTNRHCVDLAYLNGDEIRRDTLRLGKDGTVVFTPAIASWRISFPPGRTFEVDPATVQSSDEHDLGAFRTTTRPDGIPVLPLARGERVVAGEDVVLLAYPGGATVTARRRGLGSFANTSLRDELRSATSAAARQYADTAGVLSILESVPTDDKQRAAYVKSHPSVALVLSTLEAVQDRAFFDALARAGQVQPDVGGNISVSGVRPDSISFHTLGGIGGSSGGPLINAKLMVIGINHAGFAQNDRGAQFQQNEAVPVDFALRFLPTLRPTR